MVLPILNPVPDDERDLTIMPQTSEPDQYIIFPACRASTIGQGQDWIPVDKELEPA